MDTRLKLDVGGRKKMDGWCEAEGGSVGKTDGDALVPSFPVTIPAKAGAR